ncbi:MAG: trypsin-like peptidase domain-containing protein [Christensenellales bacterium]
MRRRLRGVLAALWICLGVLPALAAGSVPEQVIDAREQVYRVVCANDHEFFSGSSFIVKNTHQETYLATNYHVIEQADRDQIIIVDRNGQDVSAEVVDYHAGQDVCLLKTERSLGNMEALPLAGDEAPTVGSAVYALGFPGAADYLADMPAYQVGDITLTDGIVNSIRRLTVDGEAVTYLQMSAAISHGNSGGPLLDAEGRVLGINTLQITDGNQIYAAVSVQHLRALMQQHGLITAVDQGSNVSAITAIAVEVSIGLTVVCVLSIIVVICAVAHAHHRSLSSRIKRVRQPMSIPDALRATAPMLTQLQTLHLQGRVHGSVTPRRIFVDRSGALHLRPVQKSRRRQQDKPFLAPELLQGQLAASLKTDVYAFGAIFCTLITGNVPEDATRRAWEDQIPSKLSRQGVPQVYSQILLRAMAIRPQERTQNIVDFCAQLQSAARPWSFSQAPVRSTAPAAVPGQPLVEQPSAYAAPLEQPMVVPSTDLRPPVNPQAPQMPSASIEQPAPGWSAVQQSVAPADPQSTAQRMPLNQSTGSEHHLRPRKRRGCIPIKAVLICTGVLLVSVCAGFLAINEYHYRQTVICVEAERYDLASRHLPNVLLFYRDTQSLNVYVNAHVLLDNGRYQESKDLFIALGDYRQSPTMAQKCDYQRALALVDQEKYDEAKAVFIDLGDYADAAEQQKICDFEKAVALQQAGEYVSARKIFLELGTFRNAQWRVQSTYYDQGVAYHKKQQYAEAIDCFEQAEAIPDAQDQIRSIRQEAYNAGCTAFNESKYGTAMKYFTTSVGFSDADVYLLVLQADCYYDTQHTPTELEQIRYDKLMELWAHPQTRRLIQEKYMNQFMWGSWRNGQMIFRLYDGRYGTRCEHNFPSDAGHDTYYQIEGDIYYGGDEDPAWPGYIHEWVEQLRFTIVDRDQVTVYDYTDGQNYTLYRQ